MSPDIVAFCWSRWTTTSGYSRLETFAIPRFMSREAAERNRSKPQAKLKGAVRVSWLIEILPPRVSSWDYAARAEQALISIRFRHLRLPGSGIPYGCRFRHDSAYGHRVYRRLGLVPVQCHCNSRGRLLWLATRSCFTSLGCVHRKKTFTILLRSALCPATKMQGSGVVPLISGVASLDCLCQACCCFRAVKGLRDLRSYRASRHR